MTEQDTNGWTADHDGGWRRKIGPFTLRALRWFPDGPWRWEAVTPGFSGAVVARDAGPLTEPEALAGALAWARGTVEEMARAVGHEPATVRAAVLAAPGLAHVQIDTDIGLLRTLIQSIGRSDRPRGVPLWSHVGARLGHGSGVSWAICAALGLDPDNCHKGGRP